MISSTLHHLKLITSRLPTEITISAPNLSSFDYRGNILFISSIDAPQLSKNFLTLLEKPSQEQYEIPHAFALLASISPSASDSMFIFLTLVFYIFFTYSNLLKTSEGFKI
jgi:hypothetical protein